MAIGSAKDKKLAENMIKIKRIEALGDSSDVMIYAIGKNGTEKRYQVTAKKRRDFKN